jgi:hypothetical protein
MVMTQVIQLAAADRGYFPSAPGIVQALSDGGPASPAVRTDGVFLLYTSFNYTQCAMPVACRLAEGLHAPLTIVHFRTVPHPIAVDRPMGVSPVESEEFSGCLQAEGAHARTRVFLSRDGRVTRLAFKPHSLIVIGGRHRWWPTAAERLRRTLESAGHFVVFVERSAADRSRPRPATQAAPVEELLHA